MQIGEIAGLKASGIQLREAFGEALLDVARQNLKIVVLDGDLSNSTGADKVRKAFPERFFNLGIAESNLVGVGAGFASCGYIPFIISFPSFLFANAFDQIRLSISMSALNAKLVGSHSGISTNREGPPPMSIEDFALAGSLPAFVILAPCDPASMRMAVKAAVDHDGPVYIRSSRTAFPHIYPEGECPFQIGKANLLRQGKDVTLIACGMLVASSLDAASILAETGIQARVLDMHTVKPLDREAIASAARETGAIVTAEEHLIRNGMGVNIARVVAETHPVPLRFIGLDDTYVESGTVEELSAKYGLTAQHIATAAQAAIAAKSESF